MAYTAASGFTVQLHDHFGSGLVHTYFLRSHVYESKAGQQMGESIQVWV